MLHVYDIERGVLRERDVAELTPSTADAAAWIDLVDATEEERQEVQHLFRQVLPESDDVEEIEASARFFHDEHGLHVHSLFAYPAEGRHRTSTVAFVLQPGRLLTFRDSRLPDFRLMRMRMRRGWVRVQEPLDILLSILEQKTENLADTLEDIHRNLEGVSYQVLEDEESELEDGIEQLAHLEDSNGKIRLCLMDTQRSISFIQRYVRADRERRRTCSEIQHDLDTLMAHSTFLFERITFLMHSTQGFINIEQNQIIKIFSIAAVVFLPPTMIASIYGMNFAVMPELDWEFGYPAVITLMALSGCAPYWYFKRKGWL
jgi:magnesium transporter